MQAKTERRVIIIRYKTPDEKYYIDIATDVWLIQQGKEEKVF